MTDSRPAGIRASPLVVAPVGASVQTGLAIDRRRDGGRGLSVAFLGGSLGLRQAHGSVRSKSKTRRQSYQQNAQHKAHDGISLLRSYSFQRTTLAWDPCAAAFVLLQCVEPADQVAEGDRAVAGAPDAPTSGYSRSHAALNSAIAPSRIAA
jgi:hypothetical protein